MNIVLKNHEIAPADYEEVRLSLGKGSRNLVKYHLPKGTSDPIIDEVTNEYLNIYKDNYGVLTTPYEGIYDLLIELQNRGIKLAVNSNKPNTLCKNLIKKHFPKIDFKIIIGSREGIPYKPDPYSLNEIIETLNLKKEEVLYVGDSESDVLTAKNANVKMVGCLWGFRDLKTLTDSGADYIVCKPSEILNYI